MTKTAISKVFLAPLLVIPVRKWLCIEQINFRFVLLILNVVTVKPVGGFSLSKIIRNCD